MTENRTDKTFNVRREARTVRLRLVLAAALLALLLLELRASSAELKDGDIIFQTSRSDQSKAIQLATHSKFSHTGILYKKGKSWFVFEATGPVKSTPLKEFIADGEGGHFTVMRLKDSKILTPGALAKLKAAGSAYLGKPYDPYFEWSDDRIYCSELVWKTYKRALGIEIGKLRPLGTFDLSSHVVISKLQERYGKKVPLGENVIPPSALADSGLLVKVQEK